MGPTCSTADRRASSRDASRNPAVSPPARIQLRLHHRQGSFPLPVDELHDHTAGVANPRARQAVTLRFHDWRAGYSAPGRVIPWLTSDAAFWSHGSWPTPAVACAKPEVVVDDLSICRGENHVEPRGLVVADGGACTAAGPGASQDSPSPGQP
ncbi:hypothetical protein FRACA_60030 [Frankia canadensis]|uniref:Uncharacterized protein n=1 Tax=Frankia canadensis TaxID=1836972 RepID=A0A2I2KZF2_9ACTN|nr:hypothetical protein FRACA_60030 [Frankia canadensis]SOU58334.1 hypothetical protein FRACA_60030 [Frankia canadensis]